MVKPRETMSISAAALQVRWIARVCGTPAECDTPDTMIPTLRIGLIFIVPLAQKAEQHINKPLPESGTRSRGGSAAFFFLRASLKIEDLNIKDTKGRHGEHKEII